jgi:hypothetical protein
LYAQTQADAASAGAGAGNPDGGRSSASQEEEIVDAEIVDEADKK